MESYLVSARKYRPRDFEDVVGQQAITTTLSQAMKRGQLAQAMLFCGPRGVGKTTCARIVARKVNEAGAAGTTQDFSFNLFELDAASNNSVEDIRALTAQIRFAPQVGKYKVYIIDEVHMLSQAAFNAFLKTLEEPPEHVIFILATTEKHKIIPTIRSRCQIYDFKRITVSDIKACLKTIADKEGIAAPDAALHLIAQKADGALRDALSLFDRVVSFAGKQLTLAAVAENLNVLDYTCFFEATDCILNGDYRSLLLAFDAILRRGFQEDLFLAGLAQHFRDLLMAKDSQTRPLLEVGEALEKRYESQAQRMPVSLLFQALEILNQAVMACKTSENKRLTTEIALLQLTAQQTDSKPDKKSLPPTPPAVAAPSKLPPQTGRAPDKGLAKGHTPRQAPVDSAPDPKAPKASAGASTARQASVDSAPDSKATKAPAAIGVAPQVSVDAAPEGGAMKASVGGMQAKSKRKSAFSIADRRGAKPLDEAAAVRAESPKTPFGRADLEGLWQRFAKAQKQRGRHSYALSLTACKPELRPNFEVVHTLSTPALLHDFQKHQATLTAFLREELHNHHLVISTRLDEGKLKKRPYTPQEKYAYFVKKNPLVAKLREDLELELDF